MNNALLFYALPKYIHPTDAEKPVLADGLFKFKSVTTMVGRTVSQELALRWETTHIAETLYALKSGAANWFSNTGASTRVPEKIVSKPSRPQFYELDIPLFRFFRYPGGKAVLTPSDVARAEARIEELGFMPEWLRYLASRSGIIFETKRSGYLERRVDKAVAEAAMILREEVGVVREADLDPKLTNPYSMAQRIFTSELSERHVADLEAHAASRTPIKFRGRPHTVHATQGGFNLLTGTFDVNYDLIPIKK